MKVITANGTPRFINVYDDGELGIVNYSEIVTVESIETNELAKLRIDKNKAGQRYVAKGGQKRVYIDNAVVTDRNNIPVSQYLDDANLHDVEVTIMYKATLKAPDLDFAEFLARSRENGIRIGRVDDLEFADDSSVIAMYIK